MYLKRAHIKDHFQENRLFLNRIINAVIFIVFLCFVLLGRLFYLQIINHDSYIHQALSNQSRNIPLPGLRGLIWSSTGELLAENVPVFSLEINPHRVYQIKPILQKLAKIISISDTEMETFYKQLKHRGILETIPIKNKLTEEEIAIFSLNKYLFPEVEVVARLQRNYPYKELFSHVLGYTGPINEKELQTINLNQYRGMMYVGKSGVEKSYEHVLYGYSGYHKVETNAFGKIVRTLQMVPAQPGADLVLSINFKLQQLAADLLRDKRGAIVAIEPQTGQVLALVSMPGFDPNLFVHGISQEKYNFLQNEQRPLFNRAIAGQYPPGSTVKPIIALQALEYNIIKPAQRIFDPGYYKMRNDHRIYHDWKEHGHGNINLTEALAESCTTYFYYLADKMGIEKLHNIFDRFGLGTVTGIDIGGELTGVAPSVKWKRKVYGKPWFPGETLSVGIGQGYALATPLQMAVVAATIANRGVRVQPTVVKHVKHFNSSLENIAVTNNTAVQVHTPEHWDIIIEGMRNVIDSPRGTGHRIYSAKGYHIAGKTGTAQVFSLKANEKYNALQLQERLRDHGWFIAFAPVEAPKIAIAVLVENYKGIGVSMARAIMDSYLQGEGNVK